ncbi:MAG: HAD family phosphatase [Verrucomicrobia bacterium]|nr:HAD family phosphatase [Verrucomicrobiota bacterium]
MPEHKGILFDFDGTLARTMEDNYRAWRAITKDYGLDLQPEDYYPYEGLRAEELVPWLFRSKPLVGADARTLSRLKDEYYLKHHQFSLYPGVERLVSDLKHHKVSLAIVTAGLRGRIEKSVPPAFLASFDTIITGEMTARGKPHPDPYLKATEQVGLEPSECIVVENAPIGVEAAKAAGCFCVAVCSTVDRKLLKRADAVVDSFRDISKLAVIQALTRCLVPSVED